MNNQIVEISMDEAGQVEGGFLPIILGIIDVGLIAWDAYQISKL
jgi:hypothetical protein